MFETAFSPKAVLKKIHREFLYMKQTNESVNELAGICLDRARFCPEYMENPKRLMNHFHEVLKKKIREFVNPDRWTKFEEFINGARNREIETKREDDDSSFKRKVEQAGGSTKRFKSGGVGSGKTDERREPPECKK